MVIIQGTRVQASGTVLECKQNIKKRFAHNPKAWEEILRVYAAKKSNIYWEIWFRPYTRQFRRVGGDWG